MFAHLLFFLLSELLGVGLVEAKGLSFSIVKPFRNPSPDILTSNILYLNRQKPYHGVASRSAAYVLDMRCQSDPVYNTTNSNLTSIITAQNYGQEFSTKITFGSTTFDAVVDTGSSDTWLIGTGFSCVDPFFGQILPEKDCHFGPRYMISDTFSQIPNENFNISYADGEFVTGIVGYENVGLGGLTVNQTIAVVNSAAWNGDNITSGLIGLAYPAITSAFNGTDPKLDHSATGAQIPYSPVFQTMHVQGLVAPIFSLAIERETSGPSGYLALGGLPPVKYVGGFTSTPVLITKLTSLHAYAFYTINIDSVALNNVSLPNSGDHIQYIVDSGTTLNYFPSAGARAINAAFVPPATQILGDYIVRCDAQPPSVAIEINQRSFQIHPRDMIVVAGRYENGSQICISGISNGGSNLSRIFILGDTFMKNVVTVFDIGAAELRFAARDAQS